TNQLITILDNRRQTTIRNYFLKYPIESPTTGAVYHDGYVWSLYPTIPQTLSKRKIVLDRFHIIQHLGRAFLKT
ncbi:transposase, partial [Streptococcus thermophilus]